MSNLVIRRNLFSCPVSMRVLGTSAESEGTGLVVQDGVATITPGSASNPYAYFPLSIIPVGGPYTFACTLEYLGDWGDTDNAVVFYGPNWSTLAKAWRRSEGTQVRRTFTLADNGGTACIRFRPYGDGLKVSRVNIESSGTFDESLPYFDYGTMPDPRSA